MIADAVSLCLFSFPSKSFHSESKNSISKRRWEKCFSDVIWTWSINIYTLHLLKFPLLVVVWCLFFQFAFICHIKKKRYEGTQKNPSLQVSWLALCRPWWVAGKNMKSFSLCGLCYHTVGVAMSLHPPWHCRCYHNCANAKPKQRHSEMALWHCVTCIVA